MADLTWTNETRRLGDLIPWPRNPRQIRQDQARRLSESLDQFGQVDVIAIGPGGEIYNGHQRLNVWADEHGPDLEVAVRVSSRPLTEKEREKLVVLLHRGAVGEWDFDLLANEFELDELLEWGFEGYELGIAPDDQEWLDAFADGEPQELDKVNLTFILRHNDADLVRDALSIFGDNKNDSIVLMAQKCLTLSSGQ